MNLNNENNLNHNLMFPCRKNIRASFSDYSSGDFFVTICTKDKTHYFGEIKNGEINYSPIGKVANHLMENLESHYPYLEIRQYVIMPNHVHAIFYIDGKFKEQMPKYRTALSVVVGGYKQAVTMFARKNGYDFGWQTRFHDHIITRIDECNKISEYIENNVGRWEEDCFYD